MLSIYFATLLLFITHVHSWVPTDDKCTSWLCFTSFVWCGRDFVNRGQCNYPPFVNPTTHYYPPALIWEKSYNVTWTYGSGKNKTEGGTVPAGTPLALVWEFRGNGRDRTVVWAKNITKEEHEVNRVEFKPSRDMFPERATEEDSLTFGELLGLEFSHTALRLEYWGYYQSSSTSPNIIGPYVESDVFVMLPESAQRFLEKAKLQGQEEEIEVAKKAKKAQTIQWGIGVGLGVPIAFALGWFGRGWLSKRTVRKV